MYVQITTRCNMRCAHCLFACTERGRDMSVHVFRKAVRMAACHGMDLTLGGGEPTLHPRFRDFFKYGQQRYLADGAPERLGLVTNGSHRKLSLWLAEQARQGRCWCRLSYDTYHNHDMVSPDVHWAFTEVPSHARANNDYRDCSFGTPSQLVALGRAKKNQLAFDFKDTSGCGCNACLVSPNGRIWRCSCKKEPLGSVYSGLLPEYRWLLDKEGGEGDWGCTSYHGRLAKKKVEQQGEDHGQSDDQ